MDDFNFNDEFEPERKASGVPSTNEGGVSAKNKSKRAFLAVGALLIAVIMFFVGWFSRYYALDSRARTLLWLIDTVEDRYYKELPEEEWDALYAELYDSVLPDQFCSYYTPAEYQSLVQAGEGNNRGVGVSFVEEGELLRFFSVVGNSPAYIAGLRSGMYLYRMGADAAHLAAGDFDELSKILNENGKIALECGYTPESVSVYTVESANYLAAYCVYRDSETSYELRGDKLIYQNEVLVMTKTDEPLESLDDDTAYLRMTEFNGNAESEFAALLKVMAERGRTNLIIDLRSNGGGYLTTCQSISSHLIKNATGENPVMATAKSRSGKVTEFRAYANDYSKFFGSNSRITVLADEYTASASECLIGAMVDYGTIGYGDIYLRKTEGTQAHSYGKGVMQSTYVAANGSALRLTSAEIFWPSGKSIHGVGVTEKVDGVGDGAVGIIAPLLAGEKDTMLEEVISRVCS